MKQLTFAPQAETSLNGISEWTAQNFGDRQARAYFDKLLRQCYAVAQGVAHHQSCRALFAPDLRTDLRLTRSGQHFVLFLETAREVTIVDFIHQSMNLQALLSGLDDKAAVGTPD